MTDLFTRSPDNPVLDCANWPYSCAAVLNPGCVSLPDGSLVLIVRVESRDGSSHLTLARKGKQSSEWRIDAATWLEADAERHPEERWGVEDARVVFAEELGEYLVTYTAYSERGPMVALASTPDFTSFRRSGPLLPPENKNAALFPRKIGGKWALLHRPAPKIANSRPSIWLSFSPDLVHWGEHRYVLGPRDPACWDADWVGIGPPAIETEAGWILLYHGVRMTGVGPTYRVGAALLDLEEPWKVRSRLAEWLLQPEADYELNGRVPNVVFPCGAVVDRERDELDLYYGAADTCVGRATASLSAVVGALTNV